MLVLEWYLNSSDLFSVNMHSLLWPLFIAPPPPPAPLVLPLLEAMACSNASSMCRFGPACPLWVCVCVCVCVHGVCAWCVCLRVCAWCVRLRVWCVCVHGVCVCMVCVFACVCMVCVFVCVCMVCVFACVCMVCVFACAFVCVHVHVSVDVCAFVCVSLCKSIQCHDSYTIPTTPHNKHAHQNTSKKKNCTLQTPPQYPGSVETTATAMAPDYNNGTRLKQWHQTITMAPD